MKILWFPRLQFDTDKLHITTWVEMCKEINIFGHKIKIAVVGEDKNGKFQDNVIVLPVIKIKFLRIMSFWVFGFIKFIINLFYLRPDLVILDAYSILFSLPLILLPRKFRPLVIVDSRTPIYVSVSYSANKKSGYDRPSLSNKAMQFYTKLAYSYCRRFLDGITVITSYYKQQICKAYGFDRLSVGVWSSGVDIERFDSSRYDQKGKPAFLQNKFVLMQHGEISDIRGVFETVKAVNLVQNNDICLFLVGEVMRGKEAKKNTLEEIQRLDTNKRVHILPPVPHSQVPEYINYCDCAIMAYPDIDYWNNNNPIKLLEYLAMGKFIICTDMWTFRDVMGDSRCAYYIKGNDPETIAAAIESCYKNKEKLKEWGREGVVIAENKYTWKKQTEKLMDFASQLKKRKEAI